MAGWERYDGNSGQTSWVFRLVLFRRLVLGQGTKVVVQLGQLFGARSARLIPILPLTKCRLRLDAIHLVDEGLRAAFHHAWNDQQDRFEVAPSVPFFQLQQIFNGFVADDWQAFQNHGKVAYRQWHGFSTFPIRAIMPVQSCNSFDNAFCKHWVTTPMRCAADESIERILNHLGLPSTIALGLTFGLALGLWCVICQPLISVG
ncbi:hypothetical protein D3C77_492940 [compost metagenome]